MKRISVLHLLGFIFGCILIGSIGNFATAPNIETWFVFLKKPDWNPPSWLFAPVWTILFTMMGISSYIIWQKGIQKKKLYDALSVFAGQFVLNVLWSFLFFGFHSPLAAFVCIILLWGAIIKTILVFYKINRFAGWLLMPYLFWVSFASYLNFSIWILNR